MSRATSFWIDDETQGLLDDLVASLGMNRSAVVRQAIRLMHTSADEKEIRRLVNELSRAVGGLGA